MEWRRLNKLSKNIALVLGEFHRAEVEKMAHRAREVAQELSLNVVEEVWVPGSMEKPLALKCLLRNSEIGGAVVLGIIERGETKHGLVMAQGVISAILHLQLELMKPIGVGILGPEILPHQIPSRLLPYAEKAVRAVARMFELIDKFW